MKNSPRISRSSAPSLHGSAEVRADVLQELIAAGREGGVRQDQTVRAMRAIGSPAVEALKWALYLAQQPKERLHLVKLLGLVAKRWDMLVVLLLREVAGQHDEHPNVKVAAREGLARIAPEDPAEWKSED